MRLAMLLFLSSRTYVRALEHLRAESMRVGAIALALEALF
jgi:hypothetical protein